MIAQGAGMADIATAVAAALGAQTDVYNGHVEIADGYYSIAGSIDLRGSYGAVSIGSRSPGAVVIEQRQPGARTFMCDMYPDGRAGLDIHGMTLITEAPGVEHIFSRGNRTCMYRNLVFRGGQRTIHIDGGLGHTIVNCYAETFGRSLPGQGVGQLFVEASDHVGYAQHVNIDGYTATGWAADSPVHMVRATNVSARGVQIHTCGGGVDAIVLEDDCQGVQLSQANIVGCRSGVVVRRANGHPPLVIGLTDVFVDQATGYGIDLSGGADLTVMGGAVTTAFQGVLIGSYPDTERTVVIGMRVAQNGGNGILTAPGAKYFVIMGTQPSSHAHGAGVVVSGGNGGDGLPADHFAIIGNEASQANAYGGVAGWITPGATRIVTANNG